MLKSLWRCGTWTKPIKIHPFDLYDLIEKNKDVSLMEHNGVIRINGVAYIQSTRVPFKSTSFDHVPGIPEAKERVKQG